MKKSDLVEAISEKTGLAKAQAQTTIEEVFELIADALAKGDKIGVCYIVPERIKRQLEAAGLLRMVFRQVVPMTAPMDGDPTTWSKTREPWWELRSDLVMPPLSATAQLRDMNARPIQNGDFSRGVILFDDFCSYPERHYPSSALRSMPPFDLARSFEPSGYPEHDYHFLIASRRFYEFARENEFDVRWVPVRIDPD